MYLIRLASDETDDVSEYTQFLEMHIKSIEQLVEVVKALKCKLRTDNLEDYFEPLRPYIETYKPKQSILLKTSHVFCECCELYVPSHLCVWIQKNPELFETDVAFFYRLFGYFGNLIKQDVSVYPLDDLYIGEDTPLSGQTNREKLKLLSSVVKHYEYILNFIL
jgi:hypothetical protein